MFCLLLAGLALGCGDKTNDATPVGGAGSSGGHTPATTEPSCDTPQEGCACDLEGEVVECGSAVRRSGGYVSCSMGERVCEGGEWSACEGDKIIEVPQPEPGQKALALGTSMPCIDNPCDPFCQVVVDDSDNLMVSSPGLTVGDDGLTLTAVPADPNANTCTDILLDPPTQTLTVTEIRQTRGLLGEYFAQRDNNVTAIPAGWTVTATRTDPSIAFEWGDSAPGLPGIGADDFSVRWTGYLVPGTSEDYTIYSRTDDGARVWVNGNLVINHWNDQGPTQYASAPIALTKGVPMPIRVEYFEHGGGASAQLKWSSASVPEQIIPEANLSPTLVPQEPFTTDPANATLTVSVVPPSCYDGVFTAAWGIDTLDRASVDNGVVTLYSPIAGPMAVSAYVQEFSDTATVNVVVNATDVTEAPAGSAAKFAGASSGADTATILYPYDATVFPLGLKPPVLQWDTAGVAADSIEVSLAYPAVGTPTFQWSKIMVPPGNARYAFSKDVWAFFERSAKAGTGKISLQRVVAGQLKDAVSKTVTFSSAPLRGKIFYTQYGGGYSDIMRLDPSGDIAAARAFSNVNGCPVCHSMSANGAKFATSHWGFSTNGGISNVDGAGNLTVLSDFPSYIDGSGNRQANSPYANNSGDWRGFAWAPFTPDGSLILATNNIYGNTHQSVVGIDTTNRTVLLPQATISGGLGTGLQGQYYLTNNFTGDSWRRFDAQVYFDWNGTSPGGPVPSNGYSAVWTGEVEGLFTEAVRFDVETNVGVRLTVGGSVLIDQLAYTSGSATTTTFSGNQNLTAGGKTSIKLEMADTNVSTETIIKLRWTGTSNPSVGTPAGVIPQCQLFPPGGLRGPVVNYTDNSGHNVTRHESDMSYDWGGNSAIQGNGDTSRNVDADNFKTHWDALVEAPATGNLQWCIKSDDGVVLTVDGVQKISAGGVYDNCAAAMAVTKGQKYAIHIDHSEGGGNAYMLLSWVTPLSATRFDVPRAYIFPPASYTVPANGLTASFYDTMDFGVAAINGNPTTPQGYQTYVPNLDFDWGDKRYSRGKALTDSDTMSGRFTGRFKPACTGIHEFEIFADDTTNIWIGGERLLQQKDWGTRYAGRWLDGNLWYDFKVDWTENGGGSGIRMRWKPACNGAMSYTAIPTTAFVPTGDTTRNGYVRQGGDNGNGRPYVVWQTPNSVGELATDVSSASPANWGLGASVMMLPTFAPDASKLVFVDGDSTTNSGWRKGLSTFDFDQAGKLFKNRRQIVNNFPAGDVIKWPTYESDSKSVMYQTSNPGEFCCRNGWTRYGYMAPTNYFEDPGKLWSVDTTAANPTPVALDKLNNGERNIDRNKAYQVTMLPTAAGGYRWAVFTSTRPYGNTINLPAVQQDYSNTTTFTPMLNTSELQSMLWVSAVDDQVSAGSDRSHPAFFLPNQAYSESGGHYLNERAYWVTEACRPAGAGAGSSCDVDEDCCGGTAVPRTGVCRIDTPVSVPPTRHCAAVPAPNACIAADGACTMSSDCCFNYPCVNNVCVKPPPLPTYRPDNFARMYTSECGKGTLAVWRFFDWQAVTPPIDSAIEIWVESLDDPAMFHTLPVYPAPITISGVVQLATVTGPTVAGWVGADVGKALTDAGVPQRKYLMVTMRLIPNTKITATPTVTDWRQSYSCPPAE